MLIDFHTHIFPDAIAPKALEQLSRVSGLTPVTDGTVRGSIARFNGWGVQRAVVMNIATSPRQQHNVNAFAAQINGSRLTSFGSVHPGAADALDELDRMESAGLRGVKLHPDYQEFDADERRAYPIYERMEELGLIVCFHAGRDPLSPDHVHATPQMLAKVRHDFPRLTMVCAHMGGMDLWDEVETHLVGKEVWLDTSFVAGRIAPEQAERIIARHGSERILFGSDCPWCAPDVSAKFIASLRISPREKDNIFYRNARLLLGL